MAISPAAATSAEVKPPISSSELSSPEGQDAHESLAEDAYELCGERAEDGHHGRRLAVSARVTLGSALGGARAFEVLARAWETGGGSTVERRRALGRLARERSPGGEDVHVAAIARRLLGGGWPSALRVVAIDAERGERIVLDAAAGVRPERAMAASAPSRCCCRRSRSPAAAASTGHWDRRPTPTCSPAAPPRA
jgi:hypothetical protein